MGAMVEAALGVKAIVEAALAVGGDHFEAFRAWEYLATGLGPML